MYKKLIILAAFLLLTACQSTRQQPEYLPGYYQPAQYHPARYEYAYYDYYGNYHASYERPAYYEQGRWHRAPIVSVDNIDKTKYIEAGLLEEEATEALGDVVGEGATIEPVAR